MKPVIKFTLGRLSFHYRNGAYHGIYWKGRKLTQDSKPATYAAAFFTLLLFTLFVIFVL